MKLFNVNPQTHLNYESPIAQKIQQRRLQILVHSCIYYHFNTTIIDDTTWGRWARELAELQAQYPEIANKLCYAKAFKGFDASTGFNLPYLDDPIYNKAQQLLRLHNNVTDEEEVQVEQRQHTQILKTTRRQVSQTTRRKLF